MVSRRILASALFLALSLACPGALFAGPFFGEWGWFWNPAPEGRGGDYSWLHYWTPEYYEARAHFHRVNLDQYPPGPTPPVSPSYEYQTSKIRSLPPMPTSPYAEPEQFYGRPTAPPEKK